MRRGVSRRTSRSMAGSSGSGRGGARAKPELTVNLVVGTLLVIFAVSVLWSFRSAGRTVRTRQGYLNAASHAQPKQQQSGECQSADPPDWQFNETRQEYPPKPAAVAAREAAEREELREGLQSSCPGQAVSFMVVTGERPGGCKTQKGCQIVMRSYKNKVDYCNLHGCKVWFCLETWEESLQGTWARYPLLRSLMDAYPRIPWFMWMDADAVFTDLSFVPPFAEYDRLGRNFVLSGSEEKVFGDDPDWTGLNAGIFLIRNCDWSKAFLDKWMAMGNPQDPEQVKKMLNKEIPNRPQHWAGDDQSSLVYLLRHHRRESEADDAATLLEQRYSLHGYWVHIVPEFEQWQATGGSAGTADPRWPFITHFVGCKLCSGFYASSPVEECFYNFDRAYTFADNQLLAMANLQHVRLADQHVRPLDDLSN